MSFLTEREIEMAISHAQKILGVTYREGLSIDHILLISELSDDDGSICTYTNVYIKASWLGDIICIVPMCIYHDAKEKSYVLL